MKPHYLEPLLPDSSFMKEGQSPGTPCTGREAEAHTKPLAKVNVKPRAVILH